MTRSVIFGTITAAIVLICLIVAGPHHIALANDETGDKLLATTLHANVDSGHNKLTAFTLKGENLTFAGIGSDRHTEVEIGSVTKTFTSELLRQQVESGDLKLDTTVGEIIDAGDSEVSDVTMLELSEHTSGLPRLDKNNLGFFKLVFSKNPYAGISSDDVLTAAIHTSLKDRGTEEYSNFGVALLGQLLAKNKNTTYADLVQENIFAPARMSESYIALPHTVLPDAPRGLEANGRQAAAWEMDGYAPAGAIRSTAGDMAKYARFLMDNSDFAYGWEQDQSGEFWHNGKPAGYSTMFIVDPETDDAYFVSGNTEKGVEDLARALRKDDKR